MVPRSLQAQVYMRLPVDELLGVVRDQVVDDLRRVLAAQPELAHVGDVEEARRRADRLVLVDDARCTGRASPSRRTGRCAPPARRALRRGTCVEAAESAIGASTVEDPATGAKLRRRRASAGALSRLARRTRRMLALGRRRARTPAPRGRTRGGARGRGSGDPRGWSASAAETSARSVTDAASESVACTAQVFLSQSGSASQMRRSSARTASIGHREVDLDDHRPDEVGRRCASSSGRASRGST